MKTVKKAVIPAAGLGTRFLPATKAIPKEMIPIIDIPMIQFIVEEAVRSGIEEIVLVTARNKESIEDHFDVAYELEDVLSRRGKKELLEVSRSITKMCRFVSIRQHEPLGLGHAVLTAEPAIGNEPFAVLLGDDLVDTEERYEPCTKQLMEIFEREKESVVGVMEVPREDTKKYGIVGGDQKTDRLMKVSQLVEKPEPDQAPSTLAIPGRYVLEADIFQCLKDTPPGRGGEIQLTDGLQRLADQKGLLAYQFEGTRYDTGDRVGYLDATLNFALRRPDLREETIRLMKKHLERA